MSNEFQDETNEADDAALKILEESGDREKVLELKLARAEKKAERLTARANAAEATGYKADLLKEFPSADADAISGKTKAEMRASAQAMHTAVEKVIAARGLTPTAAAKNNEDPRKAEWGSPPPVATEMITETPIDFADLTRAATTGMGADGKPMDRQAIIRANMESPRQMERKTIAGVLAGRQSQT